MSKNNFKRLLEMLSLDEQKMVILTYRDYKVAVQGVPEMSFGFDFQENLDCAVLKGDYKGIGMLRAGLREVFQIVISVQKHKDANPPVFNAFFKDNLPRHVFEKLYGEAGVEI